jgi:glycosyltransferase involved in cell wall biosynthesis
MKRIDALSPYDVVIAVTYYSPYVSGLTEVARIEAEELAQRGHRVAVVTTAHKPELPTRERRLGVDVYRCPVRWSVGRGLLAPSFTPTVLRLSRSAETLHLHAPMLEAGLCARLARRHTRVVLTHHIDLWLPPTWISPLSVMAANLSTAAAIRASHTIVVNSRDQADGSRFRRLLRRSDTRDVPAPCTDRRGGEPRFREGAGIHYGFLGRIVEDKGLGFLLEAFAAVSDPESRLLLGGEYADVAGGGALPQLKSRIEADPRVHVLGPLHGSAIEDFYASIDVFTLPSLAESFGIAQAEAIMLGIPSITTDLPGGRYPVTWSGLGRVVPVNDRPSLTRALIEVPAQFSPEVRTAAAIRATAEFGTPRFIADHEHILELGASQPRTSDLKTEVSPT